MSQKRRTNFSEVNITQELQDLGSFSWPHPSQSRDGILVILSSRTASQHNWTHGKLRPSPRNFQSIPPSSAAPVNHPQSSPPSESNKPTNTHDSQEYFSLPHEGSQAQTLTPRRDISRFRFHLHGPWWCLTGWVIDLGMSLVIACCMYIGTGRFYGFRYQCSIWVWEADVSNEIFEGVGRCDFSPSIEYEYLGFQHTPTMKALSYPPGSQRWNPSIK